ncbi:biphenyl 2,3-dioxygenase [Sphingobium sp. LB126]|uniref:VOC family protein n=1 Tax=Sphingobium sp. LB126 TaxID=1983755 RepID=UPI000C206362|nr:VOC family protein [Sphingobium sp. LB126]PJG46525.1 biphenyl 2,3-dioxygenase [Sphingobium sp. LB126]
MTGGEIIGLGYIGARTASLDDWRQFGTHLLGMQVLPLSGGRIGLRMDQATHRLAVREAAGEGVDYYGWEVRDAQALQSLAARLEAHGRAVSAMPPALCEDRGVADGFTTTDPEGNVLEFFHGRALANTDFVPGRPIEGFRTGSLGMGHAVLNVSRIEPLLPYYRDLLGFRLSDYTLAPFKAFFFHVNTRHHSLAMIENGHAGMHHLMVELDGFDDVGQGYDLAQIEPGRVAATLGRHSNDHMTSFYMRTPSRFLIEYGWGGRDIDPDRWQPSEMRCGPSLWGHDRDWLSDEMKAEARRLRLEAARHGMRASLRVASAAGHTLP